MSFLEIFQPGLRHLREERDRQKLMVARPPAAGPPLGIDLDRGIAVIRVPARRPPDPDQTDSDQPDSDQTDSDRPAPEPPPRPGPGRPPGASR